MEQKLKDSGIPWIGIIPEHWEILRNKNVLVELKEVVGEDTSFPLLSLSLSGVKLRDLDGGGKFPAEFTTYKKVQPHNLVFCLFDMDETPRTIGLSKHRGMITGAYNVYKVCSEIVTPDWVYYFYLSIDQQKALKPYYSGLRKVVKPETFTKIHLPVPPLAEQEAIAAYLDKKCGEIDELIEVEQQMISELEAYRQSVITEAVTHGLDPDMAQKQSSIRGVDKIPTNWSEVNLLKAIYLRARLGWRGLKAEEYVDEGFPFLSAFNIVNNQLIWKNLNFINKQRYDESPEIKLSLHDILIVKDGAGIGKCARVEDMPLGESTVNSSLGVITVSVKLYYSYLFYFFLSSPFQDNVLFLKNGMGVPHLTQENLKSVRIPLPPVEEQKAIAEYLDAKCTEIDGLIKVKQEKIETLKQYRQSLIFEAVTGKTLITNNA
jgi:type I restriction enzyme S subunit